MGERQLQKLNVIYYDGSCPMCTAAIDTVARSSKHDEFTLHDITTEAMPATISRAEVEKEIYVRGTDGTLHRNADAIMYILAQYPRWRWVARIGLLPGVSNVLRVGYNIIARRRHFLFGPMGRIFWIKTAVILGFLLSITLSAPLWLTDRLYPLVPVTNVLSALPATISTTLFGVFILTLLLALVLARPRIAVIISVASGISLILLDQSRFHPWVYHYLTTLFLLGCFSWRRDDDSGKDVFLATVRLMIGSMYVWSGIQKLNPYFMEQVFPWMASSIVPVTGTGVSHALIGIGVLIPFVEVTIGVGLFVDRYRRSAILGATAMCVFVLGAIGPFGHDWNRVVWPWNVTLLILVFLAFARTTEGITFVESLRVVRGKAAQAIIVLFGIMPILSFVNLWDSYPSWSLYSGTITTGTLAFDAATRARVPDVLHQYIVMNDDLYTVDITTWSMGELHVPPYPEPRIFRAVGNTFCNMVGDSPDVSLELSGRKTPSGVVGEETLRCAALSQ
jgi:predicted DCC family thiol-disulfide oxidoreductase YuxK